MKYFIAFLFFSSLAAQAEERVYLWDCSSEDSYIYYATEKEEFLRSSSWRPGLGPIPLSIEDAITLGLNWYKKKYPQFDDLYVESVVLAMEGDVNRGRRFKETPYYYVITFGRSTPSEYLEVGKDIAVILLNKKIIDPETKKKHSVAPSRKSALLMETLTKE